MKLRWKIPLLLIAGIGLALAAWAYDRSLLCRWVGASDLEIEFLVTDAASGAPVSGAVIEVEADSLRESGIRDEHFSLTTDSAGSAREICLQQTCSGVDSRLLFTHSFTVERPNWRFRLVAAGYQPSDWTELRSPQYQGQGNGTGKSKLIVPISLKKALQSGEPSVGDARRERQ